MEANFSAYLRHMLAIEGGFSTDPSDQGGITNEGKPIIFVKRKLLIQNKAERQHFSSMATPADRPVGLDPIGGYSKVARRGIGG